MTATRSEGGRPDVRHDRVDHMERDIGSLRNDFSGFRSDIHQRVESLQGAFKDSERILWQKMDGVGTSMQQLTATLVSLQADVKQIQQNKPIGGMEAAKSFAVLATAAAALVGSIVGGIIYISSNANNGTMAEIKRDIVTISQTVKPLEATVPTLAVLQHRVGEVEKRNSTEALQQRVSDLERRLDWRVSVSGEKR